MKPQKLKLVNGSPPLTRWLLATLLSVALAFVVVLVFAMLDARHNVRELKDQIQRAMANVNDPLSSIGFIGFKTYAGDRSNEVIFYCSSIIEFDSPKLAEEFREQVAKLGHDGFYFVTSAPVLDRKGFDFENSFESWNVALTARKSWGTRWFDYGQWLSM